MLKQRIIIGDIHGCFDELCLLLESIPFNPSTDQLISVGDVIGKGPQVRKCLQLLYFYKALVIKGNHELWYLKNNIDIHPNFRSKTSLSPSSQEEISSAPSVFSEKSLYISYKKIMDSTKFSHSSFGKQLSDQELATWIHSWPLYLEYPDLYIVHAGLDPRSGIPQESSSKILTQIRHWDGKGINLNNETDPAWFDCFLPQKKVVFGHWAKKGLIQKSSFIGIDSGCVYGNSLSAYCPEQDQIWQVKALKSYVQIGH